MKLPLVILLSLVVLGVHADVLPWQPQDLIFDASEKHKWWEFPVSAEFTYDGDADSSLKIEGFWNGKNRWIVRTALPKPGRWSWKSNSVDTGMNGMSGTIKVEAAKTKEWLQTLRPIRFQPRKIYHHPKPQLSVNKHGSSIYPEETTNDPFHFRSTRMQTGP